MNIYKTDDAAEFLNRIFPQSMKYWRNFLINNRNSSRNPPYRIPVGKISGNSVYYEDELNKFVEWENHRKKIGIGLSRYTHRFKTTYEMWESSQIYSREFSGIFRLENDRFQIKPFISFRLPNPISRYKLSISQAEQIKDQLEEVIKSFKSHK